MSTTFGVTDLDSKDKFCCGSPIHCREDLTSNFVQGVTNLICIREFPGSNTGRYTD